MGVCTLNQSLKTFKPNLFETYNRSNIMHCPFVVLDSLSFHTIVL